MECVGHVEDYWIEEKSGDIPRIFMLDEELLYTPSTKPNYGTSQALPMDLFSSSHIFIQKPTYFSDLVH